MAEPIVQRLIMVATSSWRWPPDHATCVRHASMLDALLAEDVPGNAWFCCAEPSQRHLGRRVDDIAVPAGGANGSAEDPDRWHAHTGAVGAQQGLTDDLRQACFELLRAPHAVGATSLRTFRHRVFLDRERFLAVVGAPSPDPGLRDIPFDVGLDFRFRWHFGELTCAVSTSIWSHTPWSHHHRPPSLGRSRSRADLPRRPYQDVFEAAEREVVRWLSDRRNFTEQTLRVFDRPYRAPVFWAAVPEDAGRIDPLDYLGSRDRRLRTLDVVGPLLGVDDPRAVGVSRAVIGDEVLVLRRFAPAGTEDVPRYLLLPGRPPRRGAAEENTADENHDDRHDDRPFRDQEDRLRETITTLADLEFRAATELWNIQSDLEIWENQLEVYDHIVERGNALWDGLAGHLLQHRGRDLDTVHRSIELVHQTMLQGVADADGVATLVDRQQARIPEAVNALTATYTQHLAERKVPGGPGLCEAITTGGPIAEVRQRATAIGNTAARVTRNYRDLVQGISDAFDERRVRETDALQRATFSVGLVVGFVGLVTVADTTAMLQGEPSDTATWLLRALVWFSGLLLLVGVGRRSWWLTKLGALGSRKYRRTYRVVWEVLRYCSTDHIRTVKERLEPSEAVLPAGELTGLEHLSGLVEQERKRQAAQWADYDERIARRWAAAWDRVSVLPGDVRFSEASQMPDLMPARPPRWRWWAARAERRAERRAANRDLEQLARMVEKWSLRTFLVAERPLEMWESNLPRLATLYCSAMQLLGSHEFRLVSKMDFYFLLANRHHGLDWDEVARLHRWLDREIRRRRGPRTPEGLPGRVCAADLLAAVEALGLRAGMVDAKDAFVARLGERAPVDETFDPFSPGFPGNWHPAAPVVYSPRMDRWVVTGPAEAAEVLGDGSLFSPVEARRPLTPLCGEAEEILADGQRGGPLSSGEPAVRARNRTHHARLFGGDAARAAETDLRTETAELVAAIRPAGHADLVETVLRPLPMRTVLRRLGLADADAADLGRLAASARRLHGAELTNGQQVAAAQAMADLWTSCHAAAAAQPPGGPLAGLDDADDRAALVVQAVLSGPASTTALLGNTLLRLLGTPAWAQLCADPGGHVEDLVEDCLRHATPVALWRREATRAVTVGGAALSAGARILVHIGAANLADGPHLSFGAGAHACPGADLARAHARVVLTTLATRLPGLRRAAGHEPAFMREIGLHGPTELLVEWDP